jgi:hypothetical protein
MHEMTEQSLARALRAGLLVRRPNLRAEAIDRDAFAPAIPLFADADEAYRGTIRATLRNDAAQSVLSQASAFQARVREIRTTTRVEIGQIYGRAGMRYGDDDPLDVVQPAVAGLSHVDAVRVADLSDRARATVARLRDDANGRVVPLLKPDDAAALIDAKRRRITAFRGAIHGVVMPIAYGIVVNLNEAIESLATLADGWY